MCTSGQLCMTGVCTAVKRLFVTSTKYPGNLGGLTGADQKCLTAAQAANLGGSWKAWLSDSSNDALDRITDVGPWYVREQSGIQSFLRLVFNNKANLATTPIGSLTYDERGVSNSNDFFWTGTLTGGVKSAQTCVNWTSSMMTDSAGVGSGSGTGWTQQGTFGCATPRSILCIEQ